MTFGDFEEDDAFDREPPDAEQVARRIHRLRHERGRESVTWDDLTASERLVLLGIVEDLLAWLRRQGAIVS